MNRKGLLVLLALVLGAAMAAPTVAASAGSSVRGHGFATLEKAVAGNKVAQRVVNGFDQDSSVDALVTFKQSHVMAAAIAAAGSNARVPVKTSEALVQQMYRSYAPLKQEALQGLEGVEVLQDYSVLPLSFVRIHSRAALLDLANRPEVDGIAPDYKATAQLAQSLPLIHQPDAALAGYKGAGTAVAVLDTGVDYTRSAFGSCSAPGGACKVAYAQDFAPDDGSLDDNGHGTNVSGIVVGVAPDTKVLGLDVFTGASASFSVIANAVNFVVSSQPTYNTRSMNLSLGVSNNYNNTECSDPSTNPLVTPFANARAVGVMPVLSAGNSAYHPTGTFNNGVAVPSCTPGAMRVGAVYDSNVGSGLTWGLSGDQCTDNTTAADQITCFSQTGPLLTVLAPGALIDAAGIEEGGTSQASPHVAGAVAVLAAKNPSATLDQIRDAIANSGPLITDPRNGQQNHRFDLLAAANAIGGPGPGGFRPDARIGIGSGARAGNDVYADTAAAQQKSVKTRLGRTAVFTIELQNDSTSVDDLIFQGSSGSGKFTVNYFTGGAKFTSCVVQGCSFTQPFNPGDSILIVLKVKVSKFARPGSSKTVTFVVVSGSDPSPDPPFDIVKAKVTAKV